MQRTSAVSAACSIALLCASAGAQIFHRAIGLQTSECGYCVETCSAASGGGFITAGRLNPSTTANREIYVVRYDATGADSWSRVIGVTQGSDDVGFSVRQAQDGGFIIAAETNFNQGLGIGLIRLNPAGGFMWGRAFAGTPFQDFPSGVKVRELSDGTFTVIGRYRPGALLQGRMVHVGAGGAPIWAHNYTLGGAQAEVSFTDLRSVPAGAAPPGYFVSGWIRDAASSLRSALIMRTDAMGNPVAAWTYSLPGESLTADGLTIAGSNIIFSGRASPSPTVPATSTVIAAVTQAAGALVWSQREADFRNGFAALATDFTRVVVAGTEPSSGDIAMVRLGTAAGGFSLANSHGAQGEGHDIVTLPGLGAGYILTGFENLAPTNGLQDVGLIRTNSSGDTGCLVTPKPGPVAVQLQRTQREIVRTPNLENVTLPVLISSPNSGNIVRCMGHSPAPCPADWNQDSMVDSRDFFAFIRDFFALDADVNEDETTNSQDFFEFVAAFFRGC